VANASLGDEALMEVLEAVPGLQQLELHVADSAISDSCLQTIKKTVAPRLQRFEIQPPGRRPFDV